LEQAVLQVVLADHLPMALPASLAATPHLVVSLWLVVGVVVNKVTPRAIPSVAAAVVLLDKG
jgi:hypothetical protein